MSIDEQSNFMDIAVAVSQLIRERNGQIEKMKMLRFHGAFIITDMIEKLREEMAIQQNAVNSLIVPSKEVAENAMKKLFADTGALLNDSFNPVQTLLSPSSPSSASIPYSPQLPHSPQLTSTTSISTTTPTSISIVKVKSGWKGDFSPSNCDDSDKNYPVLDGIKDLGSSSLNISSCDNKQNGNLLHNHTINNDNSNVNNNDDGNYDNNNDNNELQINNNNYNINNNNLNTHCYTQALNDQKDEINEEDNIFNNGLKKNISESSLLSIDIDIGDTISSSCVKESNEKTSSATAIIERQGCEYNELEFSSFIVCDVLECIQGKTVCVCVCECMTYDYY